MSTIFVIASSRVLLSHSKNYIPITVRFVFITGVDFSADAAAAAAAVVIIVIVNVIVALAIAIPVLVLVLVLILIFALGSILMLRVFLYFSLAQLFLSLQTIFFWSYYQL